MNECESEFECDFSMDPYKMELIDAFKYRTSHTKMELSELLETKLNLLEVRVVVLEPYSNDIANLWVNDQVLVQDE